MRTMQHTLRKSVHCSGIGLHSGKMVRLTIHPAPVNHGIQFARVDIPHRPVIHAHFRQVIDTSLATTISSEGAIISTIEHLMATFTGMEIDNALVEVDSFELPIMDGSAEPFTRLFKNVGVREQESKRYFFVIREPIEVAEAGKSVGIFPCDSFKITYTIDFPHPMLKEQTLTISVENESFEQEISRARTFGFVQQVDYLKKNGFALGGSLDNAIVIDQSNNILNKDGLRYSDEFVRHKILDFLGDLSLLGMPIIGHVIANKSGHTLNHALLEKVITQTHCWQTSIWPEEDKVSVAAG
ncbi:MAG: UDP-3-O-acyl-N-acetylglucosamine deacetylase [Pseudomonadota bacterium]